MKRSIRIHFINGQSKDLPVSKATAIKADISIIHLDKLPNNTYRLTFSTDIAPEFNTIKSLEIIREN